MKPLPDFHTIRQTLKVKNLQARQAISQKHQHVSSLLLNKALDIKALRDHSSKLLSAGAMAGTFLLTTPTMTQLPPPNEVVEKHTQHDASIAPAIAPQKVLVDSLKDILPEKTRPLTHEEEKHVEKVFKDVV